MKKYNICVLGNGLIAQYLVTRLRDKNITPCRLAGFDGRDPIYNCPSLFQIGTEELPYKDTNYLQADITKDIDIINKYIQDHNIEVLINCLPHMLNRQAVDLAKRHHCHYYDLTEDTDDANYARGQLAGRNELCLSQCGLAPGLVNIIAACLIRQYDKVQDCKMMVGALPINTTSPYNYAFTWSADGVINEYSKPTYAVSNYKIYTIPARAIEGSVTINGVNYEYANTSGGIGTMHTSYHDIIDSMGYYTLRAPGHYKRVQLCGLEGFRQSTPYTNIDKVILIVSVSGYRGGRYEEEVYTLEEHKQKYGPLAIQKLTVHGLILALQETLGNNKYKGVVLQEQLDIKLEDI